jgi:hypothetical protein
MEAKLNKWEATTRKNVRRVAYWTGGWCLTMAITAFGPKLMWNFNPIISVLFILINTIVGVGMILMNRKYINELDELHRKIAMDAVGIAVGVGVVGGMSYMMLNIANVISFDGGGVVPMVLISLTYCIGSIIGSIRYK